ncbi:MAG: mannose-6-phosphate isomerase, class I [Saprospiraceae bacterium]
MQPIIPLKGIVQHYDWGGFDFLPQLLSQSNINHQAFAELWMGTHKNGTAIALLADRELSLKTLIEQNPEAILGPSVSKHFQGQLPFLFKILDVRKMLSIQAHPNKANAIAGFRFENEQGVPLHAPHRNFKDDNHKPEVMVALTDFWLLHGFQSATAIARVLTNTPEFASLLPAFKEKNTKRLYQTIMEMPQIAVDQLLQPLKERLELAEKKGELEKSSPDYWANLAFKDYTRDGHYDRGIFSIYLFNLVFIPTGQGIFQDAGIPHAYLEGVNVELMANSDNVFRGGLTPKHVDVPELLKHLVFDAVTPQILQGEKQNEVETYFPTPAADFALFQLQFDQGQQLEKPAQQTAFIYIVLEGIVHVSSNNQRGIFQQGDSFMVPATYAIKMTAQDKALLFGASAGKIV